MDNKIYRPLQDKINALTYNVLEDMAKAYVGRYAFVLYNDNYYVSKVKSYSRPTWVDEDYPERDRLKGDKTILFRLENGEDWELIDLAFVNDTINVNSGIGSYQRTTITALNDVRIIFSNGLTMYFPIDDDMKYKIEPILIDIGYLEGIKFNQTRTLKVGDKFKLKGFGYNETSTFLVKDIVGGQVSLIDLADNKEFTWHKYLSEANKMIEKGEIIFQDDVVEVVTNEPMGVDLEGDFIGKFLNKNANDLLELEKNNRPLFDVVEMTLNLLSKKFGGGEDLAEKVDEVIEHSEEIIKAVKEKNENVIGLTEIKIINNEGIPDLKNKIYTTWSEFNDALKPLYDSNIQGYNKVKFRASWEDGSYIMDRVDVGVGEFDPYTQKVGEYVDRPFMYYDNLKQDVDMYEWDDEIVVMEEGDEPTPYSKEDIENEIDSLKIALMYEDDQEKIDELKEKIQGLEITLSLL